MRRALRWIVWIPAAILLVAFSIANRAAVTVSLDPFSTDAPAFSFALPLFILLFAVLLAGILVGGMATWLRQGRWRRAAREAERLRRGAAARRAAQPPAVAPAALPSPAGRGRAA